MHPYLTDKNWGFDPDYEKIRVHRVRCNNVILVLNFFAELGIPNSKILRDVEIARSHFDNTNSWIPILDWYKILDNCQEALPLTLYEWEKAALRMKDSSKLFGALVNLMGSRAIFSLIPKYSNNFNTYTKISILLLSKGFADILITCDPSILRINMGLMIRWTAGVLNAIPTACSVEPGISNILFDQAPIENIIKIMFKRYNFLFAEQDGQVFVNGSPIGKRIRLLEEKINDHRAFSGNYGYEKPYNAFLMTKNLVVDNKILLKKDDIFDAPYGRVQVRWKEEPFLSRLGRVLWNRTSTYQDAITQLNEQIRFAEKKFFESEKLREQEKKAREQLQIALSELEQAKKQIEAHSMVQEKLIQQKTDELLKTQERLIEQERLITETHIAGGMAHEIRNALGAAKLRLDNVLANRRIDESYASLMTILETIKGIENLSEDVLRRAIRSMRVLHDHQQVFEKTFKEIEISTQRAFQITQRVMEYSRLHMEKLVHPIDLYTLLHDLASTYQDDFAKNGILVEVLLEQKLTVKGSSQHFHSVFQNLVLNARDAIAEKSCLDGRITLKGCLTSDEVVIEVIDNGVGISPENFEVIFQPFFSTKPSSGMGLGLSECRKIVGQYGGRIQVESDLRETEFRVILPRFTPDE